MKIAITQPLFFPFLNYFQVIHAVDKVLLYENFNFMISTWITRNKILKKNGEPFYVHIPLQGRSNHKNISEMQIVEDPYWKKKVLKSLILNYKSGKHFNSIFPVIEQIINFETLNFHEFTSNSIQTISSILNIKTEIISNNSQYLTIENHLNEKYRSAENIDFRKIERIILIAKNEQATTFILSIIGDKLYSKDDFSKNNIELLFAKPRDFIYPQSSNTFYPNLSILDVLINCGIEETKKLITNYDLV